MGPIRMKKMSTPNQNENQNKNKSQNVVDKEMLSAFTEQTTEKNGEEGSTEKRNECDMAPRAAFRRSSVMLRSPPTRCASPSDTNRSNAAHTKIRNVEILPDTPINACTQTNTGTKKKDASRSGNRAIETAEKTPTVTRAARAPFDVVTPLGDNTACAVSASQIESSPRQELIQKTRKLEEDAISQCRLIIRDMQQAFNRQRNISSDVKTGVAKMSELLDVTLNYRRTWKAAEEERELSNHHKKAVSQQLVVVTTPMTTNQKRVATSPAVPASSKKARAKEPIEGRREIPENEEENWKTVAKKGRKRKPKNSSAEPSRENKPRPQRVKPDAVIIKPIGDHSYAEVLKDLRGRIMTDDSVRIKSVRKTQSGAILLELGRGQQVKPEFLQQLRSTIQDSASVAELKPKATIEIRDLDLLTLKEEVETAIRKLLINKEEQIQTRITAPNAREQVRAFVTLSAESAATLIEVGYVKIGWIRARMRSCEDIRRCYRCLGMGHIQANCSGLDRRDKCIRCGESGHKIKDCNAVPKCIHCAEEKLERTEHLPGSKRCPLSRKK